MHSLKMFTCLTLLLLILPKTSYADVFRKCGFEVRVEGQNLPITKIENSQFTAWARESSDFVHSTVMHEAHMCARGAYSAEDSAKIIKACRFNPLVHESDVTGVGGISGFTLTKARSAMKETICKAYLGDRIGENELLTIPSFTAYLKKTSGNGSCPKVAFIQPFELNLMCNSDLSNSRDRASLWRHKSEANKLAQQKGVSDLINGGGNCLSANQNDYNARKDGGSLGMIDCNGLVSQKWRLTNEGQFKMLNGQCLERQYYSGTPKLQLSNCNGNINEQWHYDGQFITDTEGKCLSIYARNNDLRNYNASISLRSCKSAPGYTWQSTLTPNKKPDSTQALLTVELMHATGRCLTIDKDDFERKKNGASVVSETCKKANTQQWYMTPTNEIKALNGLCLEISAGDHSRSENAVRAQLSKCNGRAHQKWSYSQHRLRSTNGKCLAMYSKEMWQRSGKVQVWDCNNTLMQKWQFVDNFSPLTNASSDKGYMCLAVQQSENIGIRTQLQAHLCNRQANQQWNLTPNGYLLDTSGRCLTASQTGFNEKISGTNVKLISCRSKTSTQQWRQLNQQLVAANGMCLSIDKTKQYKYSSKVNLQTCNNSSEQQWFFPD